MFDPATVEHVADNRERQRRLGRVPVARLVLDRRATRVTDGGDGVAEHAHRLQEPGRLLRDLRLALRRDHDVAGVPRLPKRADETEVVGEPVVEREPEHRVLIAPVRRDVRPERLSKRDRRARRHRGRRGPHGRLGCLWRVAAHRGRRRPFGLDVVRRDQPEPPHLRAFRERERTAAPDEEVADDRAEGGSANGGPHRHWRFSLGGHISL